MMPMAMNQNFVENIWTRDFSNLYNAQNEEFNHVFYDDMLQHKRLLEDNMRDSLYTENRCLNSPINRLKVEKVVFRAKNGK